MNCIWVAVGMFMAGLGAYAGIRLWKNPTKIEFRISILNIIALAFSMFATISVVMVIEMLTNQFLLIKWIPEEEGPKLLKELINSGVVIACLLPLSSLLFGRWIRNFDMDLCSIYSEKIIKIYYSLVVLVNCALYLFMIWPDIMGDSPEIKNIFNRVVIWGLNIFGTWIGIGFHCKGRISEEIENINKSEEQCADSEEKKELREYILSFGGVFVFICALLCLQIFMPETYILVFRSAYLLLIIFIVFLFVTGLIGLSIKYPSERKSDRMLRRVIKKIKSEDFISARYHRIKYSLIREEEKNYLIIHEQKVYWSGHEQDIEDKFGEKRIPIDKFTYPVCKKELKKILDAQCDFIKNGFKTCKEEHKEHLINKKINAR